MMIDLAKEFSPYPSGRTDDDGFYNGTRFRDTLLAPAFHDTPGGEPIVIDIDGVRSFGSSFMEEAFGGIIRLRTVSKVDALGRLHIQYTKPHLKFFRDEIMSILQSAKPA